MEIAKSSWAVLKADKELLLLPVLSTLAAIATMALFVVPIFAGSDPEAFEFSGGHYALLFLMYVVLAYIVIFFNAALVCATNERLNGGDPTLGSALRAAGRRAGKILPWAIVSATVSLILRSLEERAGFIGRLVIGFVGMAWTVVTYLVLPVIVVEGLGVSDAVRKSADMFRRTWGENLAAQIGFGLIGFVAAIPGVAAIFMGGQSGNLVLAIVGILWMAGVAIVMATLAGIYQTALYHFASTGTVPGNYFDTQTMREAFRTKREQRRYL